MKKVVLITGITGQDGAYLAALLLQKKYQVIGITRSISATKPWRLDYLGITKKITLISGSLLDTKFVVKTLKKYQPTELYNLAGESSVARSWKQPVEIHNINFLAVTNLLEAIRLVSPHTKFFQASSAEIFGQAPGIITEKTNCFDPKTPYGIAKLAAHQTVNLYRDHYGLFAVNGILFNHESPLRDNVFVTKVISQGVAKVATGKLKSFSLGSLVSARDFGYTSDFVDAMWRLLQMKKPENAVICTGKTHTIAEFVAAAFRVVGIKNWQQYITFDPGLVRKREVKIMQGSHARLTRLTGWKPSHNLNQLVRLLVGFELKK